MSTVQRDADPEGFGILRPGEVRSANASAVLRYLLAHGPTPRSTLADLLGLTRGPVTRIVALLIELGLVREGDAEPRPAGRGRPKVPVMINADALHTIAAHIGATQVTVSRVDLAGQIHAELTAEHDSSSDAVLETTGRLCRELAAQHPAKILGIGAVSGGWVDATTGMVRDHPRMRWQDVAVKEVLEGSTGLPVYVDSAAHSHCVGDIVYGLAFGIPDFVHIFIGNVIEMATATDGRVHPGLDGFGGDLSHWILDVAGQPVSAIDVISDFAVRDAARAASILGPDGTYEDLVVLAADDERAGALITARAARAAQLVAGVATIVAPSAIVVSSGVVATDDAVHALEHHFHEILRDRPRPDLIVSTDWRAPLATAGAAIVVERALLHDPLGRSA